MQSQQFAEEVEDSVRSVAYSVDRQSREIIANREELESIGYTLDSGMSRIADSAESLDEHVKEVGDAIERQTEILGHKLDESIEELSAKFDWGFTTVLIGILGVNATLAELLHAVKNPIQTWANNQFEIGCDAMRRCLYPEARDAFQLAIDGDRNNRGYRLDPRYHFALGLVYLGNYENFDAEVVDVSKAIKCFIAAARYAEVDAPEFASSAWAAAAWAALALGRGADAIVHARNAQTLSPENAEASFILAKALVVTGEVEAGFRELFTATDSDADYSLKILGDPDFISESSGLRGFLRELREREKRAVSAKYDEAQAVMARFNRYLPKFERYSVVKVAEIIDEYTALRKRAEANTFFGWIDVGEMAERFVSAVDWAFQDLSRRFSGIAEISRQDFRKSCQTFSDCQRTG